MKSKLYICPDGYCYHRPESFYNESMFHYASFNLQDGSKEMLAQEPYAYVQDYLEENDWYFERHIRQTDT